MGRWILSVFCAGLLAGAGWAAPVDQDQARKLLFSARGADAVVIRDSRLDEAQLAKVELILRGMKEQGQDQYYGAIAISPTFFSLLESQGDAAVFSGLLQIATQYHSAGAADSAAMTACRAARKSGQADCVLAARVLPRKWTQRPLQMSVAATEAFRDYRKGSGPKAFAISTATTAFAAARGEGAAEAALTRCNSAAAAFGRQDCEIVVAD